MRLSPLFLTLVILPSLFLQSVPVTEAQNAPAAPSTSSGTRCATTGGTMFLRFNYVPVADKAYPANKAIIYVPKEAQCAGTFPMYIHLHGDNGRDDISNFYLPCRVAADGITTLSCRSSEGTVYTGGRKVAENSGHGPHTCNIATAANVENGTNRFQDYMEDTMRNTRIPGMIFVLPVNGYCPVNWDGVDANAIKQAAQAALNAHTQTQNIRIGNDLLVSGHSGAGCRQLAGGDNSGILKFQNANPIAVGVLDTCTEVYPHVSAAYPNARTILFYASIMAYSRATFVNNAVVGGYHNALRAVDRGFQQLSTCNPATFFHPHNPATTTIRKYGTSNTHFRGFWDTPILDCAKSPTHPWYALFATEVDHASAAGLGVKTLLSLTYSQNTPEVTAGVPTTANPPVTNAPANPGQPVNNSNPNIVVAPLTGGNVPLEVSIAGINAIAGANQGYIVNYTQILFTYAAGIAGTVALIVLIGAGMLIIIGGSGETVTKAKQIIVGCISGLVLLGVSGWILYLINPCFFNFGNGAACVSRGPQAVQYTYIPSDSSNASRFASSGNPPPQPTQHCTPENICDVVLDVPFIRQGTAPDECTYAGICATNPNAGEDTAGDNHKWSGVSCGAAAFSSAYLYVSGITDPAQQRQFFSDFINNYYRCGIHNLPPGTNASIREYDAANAPHDAQYNLCAYELGTGGRPGVMITILKTVFGANGTHPTELTPAAIFRELSAGHPIVVAGVLALQREGGFEPRAHFTVIKGIQGYNAANQTFTNLVIQDVGRNANSIMTQDNYNTLRTPVRARDGTMHTPLHGGVAVSR